MRRLTRSNNNVNGDNPNPDPDPQPANDESLSPYWMKRGGFVETDKKDKNSQPLYRTPQPCETCRGRGERLECLVPSLRPVSVKGFAPGFFHSVRCTACSGGGHKCSLATRRAKWAWLWDPTAGEAGEYVRTRLPKQALDQRTYQRAHLRAYRARVQRSTWGRSGSEQEQEPSTTDDDVAGEDNDDELVPSGGEVATGLPGDESTGQPRTAPSPSESSPTETGGANVLGNQVPDIIELLDSSDDDDGPDVNWSTTPASTAALKHRRDPAPRPGSIKRPRISLASPSKIKLPRNPSTVHSGLKHSQNNTPSPNRLTSAPQPALAPIPTNEGATTAPVAASSQTHGCATQVTSIKVEHGPIDAERDDLIEGHHGIQTPPGPVTPAPAPAASTSAASVTDIDLTEKVKQLEAELKSTKAKLKATREECDDVTEERDNLLEMYRNSLRKGKERRVRED